MKSIKQLSLIVVLAVFATSCSMNGLIQKRKYTGGYYLSMKKKNAVNKETETKVTPELSETASVETKSTSSTNETSSTIQTTNEVADISNEESTVSSPSILKNNNTENGKAIEEIENVETPSRHYRKRKIVPFKSVNNNISSRKPTSTNDDTLLYIILAILLPWLAVGLYTNWDTTKTLIAVILWLLFWIPGIIYALLVVTGSI